MYVETFKVFSDLAETGSFSKAAALNQITQSAVSQQIRTLENRFQVTLIERGRRNFALTPEGTAFLNASREILGVYNHLGDRLLRPAMVTVARKDVPAQPASVDTKA